MPELIDAGVGCFKIEGRLKGEEYVAITTAAYRQAVDQAWHGKAASAPLLSSKSMTRTALAQVFARGCAT